MKYLLILDKNSQKGKLIGINIALQALMMELKVLA
jgi:hypothetical protein